MNESMKFGVYTRNNEDIGFNFKTSLSAKNKIKFVNSVTETLVGDNYNYIIKDMVFDFMVIRIFTDVDTSFVENEDCHDPIEFMEDLLNETNIVDIVKANDRDGIIEELQQAIDYNIEYRTGVRRNSLSESLTNLLNTIEKKLSDADFGDTMDMYQVLSGMSGELTADKLLEAYSKSSLFKNQHKQLPNKKKSKTSAKATNNKKKSTAIPSSPPVNEVQ